MNVKCEWKIPPLPLVSTPVLCSVIGLVKEHFNPKGFFSCKTQWILVHTPETNTWWMSQMRILAINSMCLGLPKILFCLTQGFDEFRICAVLVSLLIILSLWLLAWLESVPSLSYFYPDSTVQCRFYLYKCTVILVEFGD